MTRILISLLLSCSIALARSAGPGALDPGTVWREIPLFAAGLAPNVDVSTKTVRSITINPAQKTLVMIAAGQSLGSDATPTNYTPANPTALDNLDPTTGLLYAAADPLVGATLSAPPGGGVANYNLRLADAFVTNGIFNRVIIVPVAIAATSISQWSSSAAPGYIDRTIRSAALKLAARGVTPSTTGVTFAVLWNQGESDTQNGTTQIAYAAGLASLKADVDPVLPGVRWFISTETWISGGTSAAVAAAQSGFVDNITRFAGANFDSMNATFRLADNTHLNDTGAAQAASLLFTAMHASGSPF